MLLISLLKLSQSMFHYCGAIVKAAIADSGLPCAVVVVGAFIPIVADAVVDVAFAFAC